MIIADCFVQKWGKLRFRVRVRWISRVNGVRVSVRLRVSCRYLLKQHYGQLSADTE